VIDFAFSTLGVPGLPIPEVLALATRTGYTGLELRCAEGEPIHPAMPAAQRRSAATAFRDTGITPLCLASYIKIAAPGPDGPVIDALRAHLDLAADLGAANLRVFPGGPASDRAAERLGAVTADARSHEVRVLVETHDSHPSGRDLAALLAPTADVGTVWDVMHTHLCGESPRDTYAALADRLAYIQLKDVSPSRTPVQLGEGVLPLEQVVGLLVHENYSGWVSWEYEAAWFPEAAPLPSLLSAARAWLSRLHAHP
jgi:sugar phosphate isomerase/epimerase